MDGVPQVHAVLAKWTRRLEPNIGIVLVNER
jgi:hypothetical protein